MGDALSGHARKPGGDLGRDVPHLDVQPLLDAKRGLIEKDVAEKGVVYCLPSAAAAKDAFSPHISHFSCCGNPERASASGHRVCGVPPRHSLARASGACDATVWRWSWSSGLAPAATLSTEASAQPSRVRHRRAAKRSRPSFPVPAQSRRARIPRRAYAMFRSGTRITRSVTPELLQRRAPRDQVSPSNHSTSGVCRLLARSCGCR